MARITHVKKARKDYPASGIKAGEPYYWWAFRYGGKHKSKTCPRASQLTQSPFLSQAYSLDERAQDASEDAHLPDLIYELTGEWRELGDECQGSLDNMPDSLQDSESGQLLQERIDKCEEIAGELESIDVELEGLAESELDEKYVDILQQLQNTDFSV